MVRRRPLLLSLAAVAAIVLLVVVGLWTLQRGRVLPNTSVAGIDVSRMTPAEVAAAIEDQASGREQDEVVFLFEDERFELVPVDLGYRVDRDAMVEAALSRGRTNPVGDVWVRIASLWRDRDVPMVEVVDRPGLQATVDDLADQVDRDPDPGAVTVDPDTLAVQVDEPVGAAEVRRDETFEALQAAVYSPGPDELELPADTEPPPVDPADVAAVGDQVERAIDEPLVLTVEDESLTLDPAQLASLLEVGPNDAGDALELHVTEASVEEQLADEASDRFDRSPIDATFETSRTPPTSFDAMANTTWTPVELGSSTVVPGREGFRFDPALAADQLTGALRDGVRDLDLEVEVIDADLPTAEAEDLAPTHLLGTFTTYYTAGQTRNANIQRLADEVDNTQVLPGEQFSINDISGERTCSRGYQPAGTIVRGELVDTCGGGVSQFGTTTFNAAFFSGVQLDQWQAHSFYISRYPRGREATLSYPQLDVRFTNTTDGVIIVRASYTSTSITVTLYGQPIAASVSATHGEPFDFTSPTTQTRTTSELPSGQERTVQSAGSGGFSIRITRTIDLLEGGNDELAFTTTYVPQHRIVERGTG